MVSVKLSWYQFVVVMVTVCRCHGECKVVMVAVCSCHGSSK